MNRKTTGWLDLIRHWRREGRERRLFFAQLEAAEAIIFLKEARADFLQGVDVPREVGADVDSFTRYGCKMATGSGKTTVMGMLAAWSILNKVHSRGDGRFSDVVLVVCPNVTIRERLAEFDPNRGDASIYRTADLVGADLMPSLRRGRVLVKNWHDFERKGMSADILYHGAAPHPRSLARLKRAADRHATETLRQEGLPVPANRLGRLYAYLNRPAAAAEPRCARPGCGKPALPGGKYCTDACKQAAYRMRRG